MILQSLFNSVKFMRTQGRNSSLTR